MTGSKIKVLIIGAGKAGSLVYKSILSDKETSFEVVGFLDDDPSKKGKIVSNIKILGTIDDLHNTVKTYNVDELIIAVPSGRGVTVRRILEKSSGLKLVFKILPRISEVLAQAYDEDYLRYIRKVQPEDLLGGEILKSDQSDIFKHVADETILITGAAGSIGSELSRQLCAYHTKKLIFFDWWENGMFDLREYITEKFPEQDCRFIIGDISDRKKLDSLMQRYKPTTIFHAAAYKHVPLMEGNPTEAIKNNILGTKNVAEIAIKNGVNKFILISSDKAVNPTNIMGATKRAAEKVLHILAESQQVTTFCAVRFGNVINSNGSAIPTFEKQIEKGGPVTVTDKKINRFFMTISEAVHLILQAWIMGENNDLFVLDMGEPIKIYDLAKLLIVLHGYVPEEEIMIKIIGLRPGEKLYEEVLVKEEEVKSTAVKKLYRTKNFMDFNKLVFLNNLNLLSETIEVDGLCTVNGVCSVDIKQKLKQMVSTYRPTNE